MYGSLEELSDTVSVVVDVWEEGMRSRDKGEKVVTREQQTRACLPGRSQHPTSGGIVHVDREEKTAWSH